MTIERWRRIEEVFYSVVGVPSERRAAVLREACGGDQSLQNEVEGLVSTYEKSDSHVSGLLGVSLGGLYSAALAEPALETGQTLGSYEVTSRIGSGGMGQVYEGRDTRLGRKVAIKVLLPAMRGNPEMASRFDREVRLASSLNHPNIVTVYDVGEFQGRRYLVTEFVEGDTLRTRLERAALSVEQIVSIAGQTASALEAAHAAGIVHRDIKPENMMLRPDRVLRLLDFGLARVFEQSLARDVTGLTGEVHTGVLMGTVPYMSPEQLRGERVDARTDLWSLGVVIFEMAAGKLPFAGQTTNHLGIAILESEPAALPPAMAALEPIVRRALTKDREQRYQSATELLRDIEQLEHGAPTGGIAKKRWRWLPSKVISAGMIVCAAAALIGYGLWRIPAAPETPVVRITPLTTNGKTHYAAISPDGRFVAYTLVEPGRQSLWLRQVTETRDLRLVEPGPRKFGGIAFSNRGDYIYFSSRETLSTSLFRLPVIGGEPREIVREVDSPVAPGPDGKRLAFVRADKGMNRLIVIRTDGSDEQVVAERHGPERFREAGPAWSPDGAWIAAAARKGAISGQGNVFIILFDPAGKTSRILGPAWVDIDRIAWLPDGKIVVVSGKAEAESSQVFRVSFPGGQRQRITADLSDFYDVTAQSDGKTLSGIRSFQTTYISIGNPARGNPRRVTSDAARYAGISAVPGGGFLTISDAAGHPEIWLMDESGPHRLTDDGALKSDVSSCGQTNFAVYASDRSGGWSIWRIDRDGRHPIPLTSGGCCDIRPRCSPDGSMVVFQSNRSGRIAAWSVPVNGGTLRQLTEAVCVSPVWRPDGRAFACHFIDAENSGQWRIAVVPAAGGMPVQFMDGILRDSAFIWDGDGHSLLYTQTAGAVSNVWLRKLTGGPANQVTHFTEDRIFDFARSDSGDMAFVRGIPGMDAVRISLNDK